MVVTTDGDMTGFGPPAGAAPACCGAIGNGGGGALIGFEPACGVCGRNAELTPFTLLLVGSQDVGHALSKRSILVLLEVEEVQLQVVAVVVAVSLGISNIFTICIFTADGGGIVRKWIATG